jgi:hypothetical protein
MTDNSANTGYTPDYIIFPSQGSILVGGPALYGLPNRGFALPLGPEGYVLTSDGVNLVWAPYSDGDGTGTVTSVSTNSTLTGGPITTTGTLGLNLSSGNDWLSGIGLADGQSLYFNNIADSHWRMGRSNYSFIVSDNLGSNVLSISTSNTEGDGFAIGQDGGSSTLEIDYQGNVYVTQGTIRSAQNFFTTSTGTPTFGYEQSTQKSVFGGFNGSSIVGGYFQSFGNTNGGSGETPSGGFEIVMDASQGATNINFSAYNGSSYLVGLKLDNTGILTTLNNTLDDNVGNAVISGNISAANLSGTNTGDQVAGSGLSATGNTFSVNLLSNGGLAEATGALYIALTTLAAAGSLTPSSDLLLLSQGGSPVQTTISTFLSGINLSGTNTGDQTLVSPEFTFYVAMNGNDITGNGTAYNPYATIQTAVNAVNALNDPSHWYLIEVSPGSYGDVDLSMSGIYSLIIKASQNDEYAALATTIGNFTSISNNDNLSFLYVIGFSINNLLMTGRDGGTFCSSDVEFIRCYLNTVNVSAAVTIGFYSVLAATAPSAVLTATNCGSCDMVYSDGGFYAINIISDDVAAKPSGFAGSFSIWQAVSCGNFVTTSTVANPIEIRIRNSCKFGQIGGAASSIDANTTIQDWGGNTYVSGLTNNGTIDTIGAYFDNSSTPTVSSTTIPTVLSELAGNRARRVSAAPISYTDTGILGDYFVDSSNAYFCISTNTWVKVAVISSF